MLEVIFYVAGFLYKTFIRNEFLDEEGLRVKAKINSCCLIEHREE